MAINDIPTLTDSKPGLRSYRGAASFLVQNEQRRLSSRGETPCPLEPCEPNLEANQPPSPVCGTAYPKSKTKSTTPSRCRSRTPSPPHPSPSTRGFHKAPRSVSPGGTPAPSARAALRRSGSGRREVLSLSPQLRVSWADALVASVRTRPRTLRKDVSALFYSRADERRFRQEAAFAIEDEDYWCESLEEDSLTSLSDEEREAVSTGHEGFWSPPRRRKEYAISKAVVVFGNATVTYGEMGSSVGGCAVEAALETDFSFDDAAFWNGQLTWS